MLLIVLIRHCPSPESVCKFSLATSQSSLLKLCSLSLFDKLMFIHEYTQQHYKLLSKPCSFIDSRPTYVTSASYFWSKNSHAQPNLRQKLCMFPCINFNKRYFNFYQERLNYLILVYTQQLSIKNPAF